MNLYNWVEGLLGRRSKGPPKEKHLCGRELVWLVWNCVSAHLHRPILPETTMYSILKVVPSPFPSRRALLATPTCKDNLGRW